MKNFYCYSSKLMKFLKLQGQHYLYAGKHPNGNTYWVFAPSEELNKNLTKWELYKKTFEEEN